MKNTLSMVLLLIATNWLHAQTAEHPLDSLWKAYIRNYKDIAMDEMARSGVPASIKLAQGILESRAGTSELAIKANNHFGIKCGKGWQGKTYMKNDDERNKKGERIRSCFRQYSSVVECFADHSEFIRNPEKQERYGFLFELDPLDYKAWAQGLQDAGYSSVDYYAKKLIYFIEQYDLHEYDLQAQSGNPALRRLAEINGVKMIQARSGETLADISTLYNIPVEKLSAYNDNHYPSESPLGLGAWVFIQPKSEQWSGPALVHVLDKDQSLFDVAQAYGIKLDKLRQRNGLKAGEEPEVGERIRLQGSRGAGDRIKLRSVESRSGQAAATPRVPPLNEIPPAVRDTFIIEMLPEEKLFAPVPVDGWQTADRAAHLRVDPSLLLLDNSDSAAPGVTVDLRPGETRIYHTVTKGDTLYSIARKYDQQPERIRQMNRLGDNNIRAGQVLRVN